MPRRACRCDSSSAAGWTAQHRCNMPSCGFGWKTPCRSTKSCACPQRPGGRPAQRRCHRRTPARRHPSLRRNHAPRERRQPAHADACASSREHHQSSHGRRDYAEPRVLNAWRAWSKRPQVGRMIDQLSGIGAQAFRPSDWVDAGRGRATLRTREAHAGWNPLVDWDDVFPGYRGITRDGEYVLFHAPVGIRLQRRAGGEVGGAAGFGAAGQGWR